MSFTVNNPSDVLLILLEPGIMPDFVVPVPNILALYAATFHLPKERQQEDGILHTLPP